MSEPFKIERSGLAHMFGILIGYFVPNMNAFCRLVPEKIDLIYFSNSGIPGPSSFEDANPRLYMVMGIHEVSAHAKYEANRFRDARVMTCFIGEIINAFSASEKNPVSAFITREPFELGRHPLAGVVCPLVQFIYNNSHLNIHHSNRDPSIPQFYIRGYMNNGLLLR